MVWKSRLTKTTFETSVVNTIINIECTPKCCHATTTILPRYANNVATLRKQYCHATTTMLPRYNNNVEKRTEDELEDKLEDRLEDRLEDNPYCSDIFQPLLHWYTARYAPNGGYGRFFRKTLFLNHIFKQCNFHKTTAGMEHLPLLIMWWWYGDDFN